MQRQLGFSAVHSRDPLSLELPVERKSVEPSEAILFRLPLRCFAVLSLGMWHMWHSRLAAAAAQDIFATGEVRSLRACCVAPSHTKLGTTVPQEAIFHDDDSGVCRHCRLREARASTGRQLVIDLLYGLVIHSASEGKQQGPSSL